MYKLLLGLSLALIGSHALAETVNYRALNPKNALIYKSGSGAIKFSVITDPRCTACRDLERKLTKIDNITVNKYLVNYFDSAAYSQNIWCSARRNQAYDNWMLYGIAPPPRSACKLPLNNNMIVAQSFNLRGTPMLIKPSGEVLYGSPPLGELIAWINRR